MVRQLRLFWSRRSPGERHQCRIEYNRKKHVADSDGCHGKDCHKVRNHPVLWDERARRKNYHTGNADNRKDHAELELLEHFRNFDEEVRELGFFGGGTPSHVDFEHVSKKSGRHVERQTTQEDCKHENPFEILKYYNHS